MRNCTADSCCFVPYINIWHIKDKKVDNAFRIQDLGSLSVLCNSNPIKTLNPQSDGVSVIVSIKWTW